MEKDKTEIFIYSRKSKWTGRGESIENQVQMCRDYIERYIPEAQNADIRVFEDEGYSGKNTKRPEFQKMMKEVKQGKCKYLVCYKLDRMGRNIIDIASLVEELNHLKVSFISVKESFDTSTPLGKTMLYIAGIFAQMEREQIAERVKDNMMMLAKNGRWLGGNTPLGFVSQKDEKVQIDDKIKTSYRLKEDAEEMKIIHFIFQEFQEKQSLIKVVEYFLKNDIFTKRGKEYSTTAIKDILTNPVYCIADEDAYEYFETLGCQLCFTREEANGTRGLISYAKTSSETYKNKDNPPEEYLLAPVIILAILAFGKLIAIVLNFEFQFEKIRFNLPFSLCYLVLPPLFSIYEVFFKYYFILSGKIGKVLGAVETGFSYLLLFGMCYLPMSKFSFNQMPGGNIYIPNIFWIVFELLIAVIYIYGRYKFFEFAEKTAEKYHLEM